MKIKLSSLLNPQVYDHPVSTIELIETHISWVILTGDFAYKIKKPVDFGFLDFSTLEKRYQFCQQEVKLNSRLAADIYLGVVGISGTSDEPAVSSDLFYDPSVNTKKVFEYAVKMKQFPQSCQLDTMLAVDLLDSHHMDVTARMVAGFHGSAAIADSSTNYGNKEAIYHPVKENFRLINQHLKNSQYTGRLNKLQQWSQSEFIRLKSLFAQRKLNGFVRECHGDMHLRNLVWLDNKPMAFDCIEFSPELRWIDVISEIAFLVMDLQDRQQHFLANHFLNSYLEVTGDYEGLAVLPFYLCYRALVRAKVDALQLDQKDINDSNSKASLQSRLSFDSYLRLATTYTQSPSQKLIIMRGLSASGKSTVSQHILDRSAAIRIRSDVERKRWFGQLVTLPTTTYTNTTSTKKAEPEINAGIYSPESSQQTYSKLEQLACEIINAGYSVIVDAAFLKFEQRKPFQRLAERLQVPYTIVEVTASVETLRQRIVDRKGDVSDATLSVLEHQIENYKPVNNSEVDFVVSVNSEKDLDINL